MQISTNLGIPDFRSKDTGFYTKLRNMGFQDPESLFNLEDFDMDPSCVGQTSRIIANPSRRFYSLAGELLPALNRWSPTHQFIRLLQDKGKLLRNYTQNIDNVESYAGILPEKVIHCHGSWKTATCRKCKNTVPGEQIFDALRRRVVATCQSCTLQSEGLKRKRPAGASKPRKKTTAGDFEDDDDEDDDIPTPGVMKPDITFFGESLPKIFYDSVNEVDRPLVDLVIVIGTSMKVAPVSEIPHHIRHEVPAIYISRDVRLSLLRARYANVQAADHAHRVRHHPHRQLRHRRRRDVPPGWVGAQARHAACAGVGAAAERGGAWRARVGVYGDGAGRNDSLARIDPLHSRC